MSDTTNPPSLASLLSTAQSVVILYPKNAAFDQLAVASALSLALTEAGKDVRLASPHLPDSTESLIGLDQTRIELGNQNLLISFDYSEDKVDKISYHIGEETGKFYLTIKPKKGHAPLDPKSMEFNYAGADADVIIAVGIDALESLDHLYVGYEEFFEKTPVVAISSSSPKFGQVYIGMSGRSCLAESVANELQAAGIALSPAAASNLLAGIEMATAGLSRNTTADTFQTIANLMRAGGRRPEKNMTAVVPAAASTAAKAMIAQPAPKKRETEMKVEVRKAKN